MRESYSVGPTLDRGIEVEVKVLNLLYPCEYFGSNSSQENRLNNRKNPVAFVKTVMKFSMNIQDNSKKHSDFLKRMTHLVGNTHSSCLVSSGPC